MSDVQQFHSLQRLRIRLLSPLNHRVYSHRGPRLQRHMPRIACSLAMCVSVAAYAQCPVQPVYPPQASHEAPENSLQQDVRASIAAQKDGSCQSAKLFQKRILSKEDLQELRRVVREHAKSKSMHGAVDAKP